MQFGRNFPIAAAILGKQREDTKLYIFLQFIQFTTDFSFCKAFFKHGQVFYAFLSVICLIAAFY